MGVTDRPRALITRARKTSPPFDHVVRAYGRYNSEGGSRLSASVTLPAFLSFFPVLAVAFLVLAIVLKGSASAQQSVLDGVKTYLPGLLCSSAKGVHQHACGPGKIDVSKIGTGSKTGIAAVIGVVGLVLAGTGWVNNLRTAIRTIWHQDQKAGNFAVKKLVDIGILAVIGITLIVAVAVSGLASSATTSVLNLVNIDGGFFANAAVKLIGIALSIGVNVLLFLFLFTRLGKRDRPFRRVLRGSLLAGCLFEVLQIFGSTYIAHTTSNPIYGIFAVIIGLIIWIGLVVQITLFAAAWTVTDPYLDDVAPSGSTGATPVAYPEGPAIGPLGVVRESAASSAPAGAVPAGAASTRFAGVAGVGLLAAGAAGVAVYGIRTLRDTLKS